MTGQAIFPFGEIRMEKALTLSTLTEILKNTAAEYLSASFKKIYQAYPALQNEHDSVK